MTRQQINAIRDYLNGLTSYRQFECCARNADNRQAVVMHHKNRVPVGAYFLSDNPVNTISLCIKTKERGELVEIKVIQILIPDTKAKYGGSPNGAWLLPKTKK